MGSFYKACLCAVNKFSQRIGIVCSLKMVHAFIVSFFGTIMSRSVLVFAVGKERLNILESVGLDFGVKEQVLLQPKQSLHYFRLFYVSEGRCCFFYVMWKHCSSTVILMTTWDEDHEIFGSRFFGLFVPLP